MTRLSDLSIRARLFGQLGMTVVLLTIVLGLSLYLLFTYRVGGPVYEQLDMLSDLRNDLTPPSLAVGPAYAVCQELETETDPTEIRRQADKIKAVEAEFRETHAEYESRLPDGPLKKMLQQDVYPTGLAVLEAARTEFLPLVGQPGKQAEVSRVLATRIKVLYWKHRDAADKLAGEVVSQAVATEKSAFDATRWWSQVMAVSSVVAIILLALSKGLIARGIVRAAEVLNAQVRELSSGAADLTARVPVTSGDELGRLAEGINAMIAKIQSVVSKVRESSLQVLATASEIAATARQQEASVNGLTTSTNEVAAAVREISATSKELAHTVDDVNGRAGQAAGLAANSQAGLGNMEGTMQRLVESTASISGKLATIREKADNINMVVTTITKVADQTNLLSINAAIEAEKAGEFGRGFLVVAREIRRLADQTAVATLDIEGIVKLMQDAVAAGVMQMDKFSDEVRSSVDRVAGLNAQTGQVIAEVSALSGRFQQVNEGVRNQAAGAGQINEAMGVMAESTRQTAAALVEFNRATAHLRESIDQLNQEIALFKV